MLKGGSKTAARIGMGVQWAIAVDGGCAGF